MAPESENLTSPKGNQPMGDDTENVQTAVSHNHGGVSTVPKDGAAAEAKLAQGAKKATRSSSKGDDKA